MLLMPANSFYHNDENQESILTKENFMGVEFSPLVRPRIKESQVSVLKSADVNLGKKQMGGGRPPGSRMSPLDPPLISLCFHYHLVFPERKPLTPF